MYHHVKFVSDVAKGPAIKTIPAGSGLGSLGTINQAVPKYSSLSSSLSDPCRYPVFISSPEPKAHKVSL